jgi:glycosyltransferase involved in cell wall biosynthesis
MLNEGEFGLFFSKHHSAIRDLVNQVDTDQEGMAQLKAKSQNGISQKYTWSYVVDQYEKVFRQLASAS